MEKKIMDIEKELGTLIEKNKNTEKRVDKLEKIVDVVYDLSSNVKILAEKMDNTNTNITKMKSDMEEYHQKEPNKIIFNTKNTIITGIVGALISALMMLILK